MRLATGGGLAGDRAFALFDASGEVINGKRSDAVHRLRTTYEPSTETLGVRVNSSEDRWLFNLEADRDGTLRVGDEVVVVDGPS